MMPRVENGAAGVVLLPLAGDAEAPGFCQALARPQGGARGPAIVAVQFRVAAAQTEVQRQGRGKRAEPEFLSHGRSDPSVERIKPGEIRHVFPAGA
jgi:hypothetical protein